MSNFFHQCARKMCSNFRMTTTRMPSEEWLRVWIYLSFILGLSKSARPRFDTSTDMGMVLVPADAEVDSVIFRLRATDEDADLPLVFDITATVTPIVRIENLPCTLYNKICQANVILTKKLTAGRLHDFAVRVRDTKGDSNSMQATISVTNATTQRDKIFPHIPTIIMVPEDTKPGKELDYILVRSNQWSGKPVYIELWQPKELFTIRQRQTPTQTRGVITLIGELDFETQSMYTLTMYATDPYTEMKKDTRNIAGLHLVVIVQDVQDVPPIFTQAPPLTKINNTIQPGDLILRVHAEDGDKGVPREVTYGLVSEGNPFTSFFNISESTGEIILARPLEELTQITHIGAPIIISVVAEEIRRSQLEPPAQATVVELGLLLGEPGNSPPYFENDNYVAWMDENAEPGSSVIFNEPYSTRVRDEDIGKAGVFALKLENNNGTFEISPAVAERSTNFILSVRDSSLIDYELYKSLRFKIIAQEVGPATNLSAAVPVTIFLRDVNDNPPEFQEELYEITLSENVTAGTRVVRVHATDKDTGSFGRIRYTQIIGPGSEAFVLNPDTGIISVAIDTNILDREITPQLQLTVEARDEDGKGLRGSVPLIINLLDVNDNAPVFEKNTYDFVLNEDSTNFSIPAIIKAVDADAESPNNEVRYELIHGNYENIFFLDEITGQLFLRKQITKTLNTRHNYGKRSISPTKLIRRKRQDRDVLFTMTARAYDLGVPHLSSTTQINILQTPLAAARIVMFVVPGENPDPVKTAQTLATITGGRITVQEIRPYTPGSFLNDYDTTLPSTDGAKRSIVIARVEPIGTGTSLVDIEKIRTVLAANGVGVISGDMSAQKPDYRNHDGTKINSSNTITTVHNEEVTIYKAENKLLFWLLIILGLLILLAIIAIIICCICPGCPFYMAPRKRRIHSCETLVARSEGRPKRQTYHRKYPIMMRGKKQAWSADPMRMNWQFNRRNTKNYGLASLPGDIIRVCDPQERGYPRKAMSLRGEDGQLPMYIHDPGRIERERRFYMDPSSQKHRRYDRAAEMNIYREHEFEKPSDFEEASRITRTQHFYRDGNAEVMRLVTRGGAEETSVTMHKPPQIIVDQAATHRTDGKDILLRRFIEDQKLRLVNQEFHESTQEDFERQSMESHQKQREISMQRQQQSEILLIPDKLEQDQHQHMEELGGDIQRLIIDHGVYEKTDRSDMNEPQDILTGHTLLIPMANIAEKERDKSSLINMQEYMSNVHDFELAKQNVLLTRLLMEKDSRVGAGLVDSASYLETQSLPGQVAAGTQTDQTAATQTEQPNRSRSDNESEEDSRMRRKIKSKKRYGDESKRIKTLWVKSPIQEEEHQYSEQWTALTRRKMKDIRDGRKSSIEPEVLREISDSLDENDKTNARYASGDDEEITRMKDSSSAELIKAHKKLIRQRKTEESDKKKTKTKRETGLEPSFRILEKEISSLGKKLAILTKKNVECELDSQISDDIQKAEKSKGIESRFKEKKIVQKTAKSITKEQSEISNDDSSGKSNEKMRMRKKLPVTTASSECEESIEKIKTDSKIHENKKREFPTIKTYHPKLLKQKKIRTQVTKRLWKAEKLNQSETESSTIKMSSSEIDQPVSDDKSLIEQKSKVTVEIAEGKRREKNRLLKSPKTADELKPSPIIDNSGRYETQVPSDHRRTSIDTLVKGGINILGVEKSPNSRIDDDSVKVDTPDEFNVKNTPENVETEQIQVESTAADEIEESRPENDYKEQDRSMIKASMTREEFPEASSSIEAVEELPYEIINGAIEIPVETHTEIENSHLSELESPPLLVQSMKEIVDERTSPDLKIQETKTLIAEPTNEATQQENVMSLDSTIESGHYGVDQFGNEARVDEEMLTGSKRINDDGIEPLVDIDSKVTLPTPLSPVSINTQISDNDPIPAKLEGENGDIESTLRVDIPKIELIEIDDVEEVLPVGISLQKPESQILETSSIQSDESSTSKSITIMRETSFLNSPKKEVDKDCTEQPASEEMQVHKLPPEEINLRASGLEMEELETRESISESVPISEHQKHVTETYESTALSISPELQISEEHSDVSSESSIKTTFTAQPYGTPRHRQLVESQSVNNEDVDDADYDYNNTLTSSLAIETIPASDRSDEITAPKIVQMEKKEDELFDATDATSSSLQVKAPDINDKVERTEAVNMIDDIPPGSEKFEADPEETDESKKTDTSIEVLEGTDEIKLETAQNTSTDDEVSSTPLSHKSLKEEYQREVTDLTEMPIDKVQGYLEPSSTKDPVICSEKVTEGRNPIQVKNGSKKVQKKSTQGPVSHRTRKFGSQDTMKPTVSDNSKVPKKLKREENIHASKSTIEKTKKKLTRQESAHSDIKAGSHIVSSASFRKMKENKEKMSKLAIMKKSPPNNEIGKKYEVGIKQIDPLTESEEGVTTAVGTTAVETIPSEESVKSECPLPETGEEKLSDISEESIRTRSPNLVSEGKNIQIILTDPSPLSMPLDVSVPETQSNVKQDASPNVEIKAKHPKEEITEAQSRYMTWYKQIQERKEGEAEIDEPPKWLRKNTRQKWLKMSPEDRKAFDLRTPEVTPRPRRKIKPLKNIESEQLRAIIRQGRRLRRTEARKNDDLPIEIFAPEKPPMPSVSSPRLKHHYLIQHSEYKYEKITPPFYLHPPPAPHSSPQMSPQNFEDQIEHSPGEPRYPDEDINSGIVMSMQPGNRLRHQQLLEKKSVFDIAYSEAAPSHLRTDSTTPPS